jgi:hypothetical protein
MHRSHYIAVENGEYSSPRRPTLWKLAQAFNREIHELTGGVPIRQVTPYEANATYRKLIDTLESVNTADREQIVSNALWTATRLAQQAPTPYVIPSLDTGYIDGGKLGAAAPNCPAGRS